MSGVASEPGFDFSWMLVSNCPLPTIWFLCPQVVEQGICASVAVPMESELVTQAVEPCLPTEQQEEKTDQKKESPRHSSRRRSSPSSRHRNYRKRSVSESPQRSAERRSPDNSPSSRKRSRNSDLRGKDPCINKIISLQSIYHMHDLHLQMRVCYCRLMFSELYKRFEHLVL